MAGPQHKKIRKEILQGMQVGGGPTQRKSKRKSTGNASWGGPHTEKIEKKIYRECKMGEDRKKIFEKIIFFSHPPMLKILQKKKTTNNI
ncbi:hypothetical protein FC06_12590 [Staphylococcus aureus]|nr:hypothetical protein FC06_12590 [Staphylococcus aureus]